MMYVYPSAKKPVLAWLYTGMAMVFIMIAVGGITRLTESGLSITEWKVVMGSVPPLSDQDWNEEFVKYQASPEYQKKNFDFTVEDFKAIFWWEWSHRQLGRLIGVVFIIPFLVFLFRKKLRPAGVNRLLVIMLLGGFQGFLGWYMVSSGLIDQPRVSHYRLAAHLMAALLTIALIWLLILDIRYEGRRYETKVTPLHRRLMVAYFFVLIVQLIYGAFVAGLDAGQIYNTWPKMGDAWIAPFVLGATPFYESLHSADHLVTIQFMHRTIAIVLALFTLGIWWSARNGKLHRRQKLGAGLMLAAVCVQFTLGVFTLLYAVPVWLGVLHQLGAVLLLLASLYHYHQLRLSRS